MLARPEQWVERSGDEFGEYLLVSERAGIPVSYTHLRAHETVLDIVCRHLLEKTKQHANSDGNQHELLE